MFLTGGGDMGFKKGNTFGKGKPVTKRACGGGLHDYRHHEGKYGWDD